MPQESCFDVSFMSIGHVNMAQGFEKNVDGFLNHQDPPKPCAGRDRFSWLLRGAGFCTG